MDENLFRTAIFHMRRLTYLRLNGADVPQIKMLATLIAKENRPFRHTLEKLDILQFPDPDREDVTGYLQMIVDHCPMMREMILDGTQIFRDSESGIE